MSELLKAVETGDFETVKDILDRSNLEVYQEFENGRTVLMEAAARGYGKIVGLLIENGASWNAIDIDGKCAGQFALENGFEDIHESLLGHAVRTELVLGLIERKKKMENGQVGPSNEDFLKKKCFFRDNVLIDESGDAVMMSWESPLMKFHAERMDITGKDVLNIGFGLGIIDREFQKHSPLSHTIVEAHPDVYQKMLDDGWDKIQGVKILFGRWQDVLPSCGVQFDAIFFDTFGEYYEDMREFHEHLINILRPNGIYSYFNGLAGKNEFFHEVYCRIAELELRQLGFSTSFETIPMNALDSEVWNGVLRKYWSLKQYNLPICRLTFEGM